MPKRLSDLYPVGSGVEIYFHQIDRWIPGIVAQHAHPGMWIKTADSRRWFVTNQRKVRPITQSTQEGDDVHNE